MRILSLLRENIVLVVCLPSLALIHYGWYNLQFNENFVSQEHRHVKVGFVDIDPEKRKKSGEEDK